jgi:hypothetical protein
MPTAAAPTATAPPGTSSVSPVSSRSRSPARYSAPTANSREDGVDGGLGQALAAHHRGAEAVLAVEQAVPPQQHLTALPERQGQQAQRDRPEQDRAAGGGAHGLQRAGLVGVGLLEAAGDPPGQPADQQVHDAVGHQPDAGQGPQDGVVGDLPRSRDRPVHPVEQAPWPRHAQVRSG